MSGHEDQRRMAENGNEIGSASLSVMAVHADELDRYFVILTITV